MELRIEENISLAEYTTLNIGGVARYFTILKDKENLAALTRFAESKKIPILLLGGGSNMLIADGVINRLVVKIELKGITFESVDNGTELVTVAAGERWDDFVGNMVERGLSGVENLSGIPGMVGAAPIQNINAYGFSVADVIESVIVFDCSIKQERILSADECAFGYRNSIFKQPVGVNLIVIAVQFRLVVDGKINLVYRSSSQSIEKYFTDKKITEPTLADVRKAVLQVRKNIGMVAGCFNSAGSFFKNTIVRVEDFVRIKKIVEEKFPDLNEKLSPWHWQLNDEKVKISTAFLMECTEYNKSTYGKKRLRGVVGLSPLHSLSIVTELGATASDVKEFSLLIIKEVEKVFGVVIETEVNFVES